MSNSGLRVGIDIGGTFTDLWVYDESTGSFTVKKVLSSPPNFEEAVLELVQDVLLSQTPLRLLAHGSTVGINTILEHTGVHTGIITTEGFEDVIEARRGGRTHFLDPFMQKPWRPVPLRWCLGVSERIRADGTEVQPLDPESCRTALQFLVDEGVEAVAVTLLNSYRNPVHELQLGQIIHKEYPRLLYSLSCELSREINEYERMSTTMLNTYILKAVGGYAGRLRQGLRQIGVDIPPYIMKSSGQLAGVGDTLKSPCTTLESGPAAGLLGAKKIAQQAGYTNAIGLDMGGTTCKAGLVMGWDIRLTAHYELFEEPNKPGSGWPLRVPMMDIVEIPVAGSTIAWLDEGSTLNMGPRSAGADPGPVCYGRGGTSPTLTDADLVLGRLGHTLAGGLALDVGAARASIERSIAKPMGIGVGAAANAIVTIAETECSNLVRRMTVARGRDPKDFALIVYGEAGPLHLGRVLQELGVPEVLIPPSPGTFPAFGLLCASVGYDSSRTHSSKGVDHPDAGELNDLWKEMEEDLSSRFRAEGVPMEKINWNRSVDMHYRGQHHELNIAVAVELITEPTVTGWQREFCEVHAKEFGFRDSETKVEFPVLRLRGQWARDEVRPVPSSSPIPRDTTRSHRLVYDGDTGDWHKALVYKRGALGQGRAVKGPAIIEEETSTTYVPAFCSFSLDDNTGAIRVRRRRERRG